MITTKLVIPEVPRNEAQVHDLLEKEPTGHDGAVENENLYAPSTTAADSEATGGKHCISRDVISHI